MEIHTQAVSYSHSNGTETDVGAIPGTIARHCCRTVRSRRSRTNRLRFAGCLWHRARQRHHSGVRADRFVWRSWFVDRGAARILAPYSGGSRHRLGADCEPRCAGPLGRSSRRADSMGSGSGIPAR